jgi:hypothetical protein
MSHVKRFFRPFTFLPQYTVCVAPNWAAFVVPLCDYYDYYNCNTIKHSEHLLFANDINFFRAVNSTDDCTLLQADTQRTQDWYTATFMNLHSSKILFLHYENKCSLIRL